jgi:HPt (histidine-containing phosphotransfer) domain-containing protein
MSIYNEIVIDLSYLEEVSGGNNEFIIEMIDLFLAQTPGHIDELLAAVSAMDWKKIAELAHKVKPTLAFMGVESVKEVMAEIESNGRNEENYEDIVVKINQLQEVFTTIYAKLEIKKQELLQNN